jgi:hypothetical protein
MRLIGLILIAVCSWQCLPAQIDVEVSSETGIFGKPESIRILFPIPRENTSWEYDISALSDQENVRLLFDTAIVSGSPQMGFTGDQRITFAVYDTGYITIPAISIITERDDTFTTAAFDYYIGPLPDTDDKLEPIKPIIREPIKFSDLLPYLIGAAVVILLFLTVRYMRSRRGSKEEPEQREPEYIESPYEEAMRTIRELRSQELWDQGKVKELYVEMSYLFRKYLEKESQIPALESTSGEIKELLTKTGVSDVLVKMGLVILERSDAVKYAKFKITPGQCQNDLDDMEAWITAFATMLDETREEEE